MSSENPVLLDHEHSVTSFILQTGCSHLNKTSSRAMIPDSLKARFLAQRECRYWNEIAVRYNDYAAIDREKCIFLTPTLIPINRSHYMKFSRYLIA